MRILRFVALWVLASGCPLDLTVPEAPARGSLTGRVDTQGQGTVEGLEVKLVTASGSRTTQQTDATGSFTFEDLAPGAYFLELRRDAFEPLLVPGVEIVSGQQTELGVLVLVPRSERVTLVGKVVGQGGAVPEGARVELVLDQTMQREAVTLTGSDGTFFLTARPGTYTLRASHPLYVTTQRALAPLVPGPPIDLTADPLSLPLNPATLSGRVLGEVDGANTPTPRAQVLVTLDSGETSTTDATGAYTFTGLAGGARQVRFSVANFAEATRSITLSPGQLATLPDVTLALSRGVIQGTVLLNDQQPAQDITVAVTGAAYSTLAVPDAAQPGLARFRIDRVPNGTYEVTASKNRYGRGVASAVQVTDAAPVATIGPLTLNVLVGEFRIDDGDPNNAEGYTRSPAVTLQLNAFAGADDFRASEDPADAGAWVAFTALNQPFTLVPQQGRHTVTAQYRRAGAASPAFQSSIVLDSLPPVGGAVELNGGELFTNNPLSLSLRLTAADPTTLTSEVAGLGAVRVSLSPTTTPTDAGAVLSANPVPYARDLSFSLPQPQGDGPITIYTQFTDNAGNPSAVVPATITLDRLAPQNVTLRIRDGALATAPGFTNTALVQLDHSANLLPDGGAGPGEPDGGYVLIKVANSSTALDPTPWQPLTATSSWFLDTTGAELKTVFARFRDAAGNQTSVMQAQIAYDATPPSPVSVTVLSGALTNDAGVTLQLAASDSNGLSPTAAVTISEDPLFSRDLVGPMPMPGNAQVGFRLGAAQGAHQVLVRYTDKAGNAAAASVTVVLDTLPPTGARLVVGNEAAVQTGTSLPVTFEAAPVDVTHMVVASAAPDCAAATYQAFSRTSLLPLADGARQVFGCLRDAAGNVAAYGPVDVTVDNAPPSAGALSLTGLSNPAEAITNTAALTVRLTGIADATSGVDALRVSTDGTFAGVPFVPVAPTGGTFDYPFVLPPGDGPRTLFAQVRDRAGFSSPSVQTTVILDTQPPVWTRAEAQQPYVSGAAATLNVAATDNLDLSTQLQVAVGLAANACAGSPGFTGFTPTVSVSSLVDGQNELFLCLRDRAGNRPPLPPSVRVRRIAAAPLASNLVPNVPSPLASGALISWSDTNAFTKRIEVDAALDPAFTQSLRTYRAASGSCVPGSEVAPEASARVGLQSGDLPLTNLRNWYFRLRAINCADVSTTHVAVPGSVLPNLAPTPTDQMLAHGELVAEGTELWLHAPVPSSVSRVELLRYCRVGISDCRNEGSWTSFPVTLSNTSASAPRPAALFATDSHWFLADTVSSNLAIAACDRNSNCGLSLNWTRGEIFRSGTLSNAVGAASSSALGVFYVRQDASLGSAPYLSMARCERWQNCADANNWSTLTTPIRVDPNEPLTVTTSDNQFFIGAVSEGPFGVTGPTAAGQPMLIKCDRTCATAPAPVDGTCNGSNCGCDGGQCGDFRFSRMATPSAGEVMQASAPRVVTSDGQNSAAWFERRCVGGTCTDRIRSSTCLAPDCLSGTDYTQASAALAQWPGVSGAAKAHFSLTASGTREPGGLLRLHWSEGSTGATWLASCAVTPLAPCFSASTLAQLSASETLENAVAVGRDSYFVGRNQLGRGSLWQPIVPSPLQLVVGPRAGALEVSWAPYEASLSSLLQSAPADGGAAVTVTLADPFTSRLTIPSTSARSVSLAFTNGGGKGEEARWTTTPFAAVPGAADVLAVPAISLGAPGAASANVNGFIYAAYSSAAGVRLGRCDASTDCRSAGSWSWSLVDSGAGFGAVQLATDYPREHQYGPRAGPLATAYSTPRLFLTAVNGGQLFLYGCMLTTPTACNTAGAFTKGRLDGVLPLASGASPSLRASGDRVQVTESTAGNSVVVRFCDGARYPQQTCNASFPSAPSTAQTNLALGHCFNAANWQSVTLSPALFPIVFPALNGTGGGTATNPGSPQQSTGEPHPARGFMVVQPRESDGFVLWTCAYGVGDLNCGAAAKNDCSVPANWKPVMVRTNNRPARYVDLFSSAGDAFPTRAMSEQSAGVYVSYWDDQGKRWNVAQCKVEPGRTYDSAWVCGAGETDTNPSSISWSTTSVLRDVQGTPVSSTLRVIGGDVYAAFSMTDRTYVARCAGGHDCMLRSGWNTYALPQVFNTISARNNLAGGITGDLVLGVPERDGGVTLLSGGRFTPQ